MNETLNRREFALKTSTVAGGLLAAGPWWGNLPAAEDKSASDPKRLVWLGLNALARAHTMSYFQDGHRGAALVAAHLMIEEDQLDEAAHARITQLFDLNWASKPLCAPFPEADPDPEGVKKIGLALAERGETLLEVGHNAIFAMLAIRGFRLVPEAATPERIEGVCQLIRAIKPWRDIEPSPEVEPPPFQDSAAASEFVLREASAAADRFIGYGQGFTGHMLTFGQSLVELAAMGDVEWAESCRTAFRKYVTVTRQGPESDGKRYEEHRPTPLRPNMAKYWQKRGDHAVDIGHVFKYPYSYYDLLKRTDNEALKREWDEKAYRIF
ncbi:MAG: hypothetical protein KDL87_04110 [Verrucomicrobiae bacterium]|nr:hypothetical protein [Verrucomicrobiae bacterium]